MVRQLYDSIVWAPTSTVPTSPAVPPLDDTQRKARRRANGYLPEFADAVATVPWVQHLLETLPALMPVHIEHRVADMVAMIVSQDSSCRYCYGTTRTLLQLSGMDTRRIRRLEENLHTADLPAQQKAALEYVRKVSRANPRPGNDDAKRLEEHGWDPKAIAELAMLASGTVLLNRITIMLAAQPHPYEKFAIGWRSWIMGPLLRLLIFNRRKRAAPVFFASEADADDGNFRMVLDSVDGLPGGKVLFDSLKRCMESDVLPRRTKALVLAVIARTLQCEACVNEAAKMLEREGFAREETDQVLDRLASPKLTPVEATMVPLARNTVRAQPSDIQPRMVQLRELVAPAQFIEFIGVAALGNALSRMTCLLDRC
ncbi:MAG: carboxymuconolactone decarboxylase family protein [Planctomycetota bacterium]